MTAFHRSNETAPCGERLVFRPETKIALCHNLLVNPKFAMDVRGVIFNGDTVTLLCAQCKTAVDGRR